MKIDVLSLFPEYFKGPFDVSIVKRALKRGLVDINLVNVRDFSEDKHKKVDDRPFGGGPGMVLMPGPLKKAIKSVRKRDSHVIYLSPQGKKFSSKRAKKLSTLKHLILLCGHYEGIDERVMKEIDEEISIGDFVLTNGCIAAIVLVDAVIRFIPRVLGDEESFREDSYENGILDFPNYTRPYDFEGDKVPKVLISGNHLEIERYRKKMALKKTREKRPDLLKYKKRRCYEPG
jgi:tRNA (guanine37-N1)-methyltransferase